MPLSRIFKKASNFILRSQSDLSSTPNYTDGEVVFCKNNVCVHPPMLIRQETDILHHPGYLTVTCRIIDERRTLFLSWIPNTTLRKHPSTVEQRSLSVTRGQDSEHRCCEPRRLSASSIPFSRNNSRRDSFGSYECSGCFPDDDHAFRSCSLSPQFQLKYNERETHRSCSVSSNSENNSLTLTPTEKECLKHGDVAVPAVTVKDIESSMLELKLTTKINKLEDEVTSGDCVKDNTNIVIDSCDNTTDDISNSSNRLDVERTAGEFTSDVTYPVKFVVNNSESIERVDSEDLVSNNLNDQINVPKNASAIKINTTKVDTVSSNVCSIYKENNEVPNSVSNKKDSCVSFANNNVSINKESHENFIKEQSIGIKEQSRSEYVKQKSSNVQYTFTRPDGVVYIDSILLRENPHILNSVSGGHNMNSSSEINNESQVESKNGDVVNTTTNSFIAKRNIDNLKPSVDVSTAKILPLRSFEENFAPSWMSSPELLALKHNLSFPESVTASPVIRRSQRCCRKFCVDLSEMRSLRLFFSDAESTKGQLVIASRECQYKILHFHHSGLERLATLLQQWHLLTVVPHCDNLPYRHFMVCRPAVHDNELHPEEGKVGMVAMADWMEMLNPVGQIEDDITLRKGIFLGGLESSLRKIVWPFLLHCFSYQSTAAERDQILTIRRQEYEQIRNRRMSLEGAAKERFIRNIQCVVEKDVVRTDRGNPYYAGDSNPHLDVMKNVLLNYAVYDSGLGYLQGMSDLLAPLLAEIGNEADAFWCFVGLMRRTIFVCTPTDSDMERNLCYLRELFREMVPEFFKHLQRHTDAMELLFCHRWILLCFKREFPEEMALKMWEACWANYLTDYFNLFLCLAIVSAYADDVIAQDLRTDEMLLHFSSLAMFMDGELILRKARGLLYQFRQRTVIPCTLAGLCRQCGPGMWDSGHAPTVECRGPDHCTQNPCPYRGTYDMAS